MPCNMAITITKAAVSDEYLASLLTPERITPMLRAYLEAKGYTFEEGSHLRNSYDPAVIDQQPGVLPYFDIMADVAGVNGFNGYVPQKGAVTVRIGGDWGLDVVVKPGGQVRMSTTTPAQGALGAELVDEVTAMLQALAGTLMAQTVAATLQQVTGAAPSVQQVMVENDGQQLPATVVTVRL